jgi:hypothetical protein
VPWPHAKTQTARNAPRVSCGHTLSTLRAAPTALPQGRVPTPARRDRPVKPRTRQNLLPVQTARRERCLEMRDQSVPYAVEPSSVTPYITPRSCTNPRLHGLGVRGSKNLQVDLLYLYQMRQPLSKKKPLPRGEQAGFPRAEATSRDLLDRKAPPGRLWSADKARPASHRHGPRLDTTFRRGPLWMSSGPTAGEENVCYSSATGRP